MRNEDLCPMSDLPPAQCALPCHLGVALPAGADPEVTRGVEPVGVRVWPPVGRVHEARDTRVRPRRPKPQSTCRWNPDTDSWVTPEHVRACVSNTCRGCKPCSKDHCEMRGTCPNHVEHKVDLWTCPGCIGVCRSEITEVETLATLVDAELAEQWSTEHTVTGLTAPIWTHRDVTELADIAGPAVDQVQFDARRHWTRGRDDHRGWCQYPREADIYDPPEKLRDKQEWLDRRHPAAVLTRWEYLFRRNGAPKSATGDAPWPLPRTTARSTVSSAADYLRGLLSGPMPHTAVFERFAAEIHYVLTHLEETLSDSRKPETGARCPKCRLAFDADPTLPKPPRLVKVYGHWCDREDCDREHDRTGVNDEWVCNNGHTFSEADYRLRIGADYLSLNPTLTAGQLLKQYGIPYGTIRSWAERGQIRKRGYRDGQLVYDAGDAARCLDESRGWCALPRDMRAYPLPVRNTPVDVMATGA